NCVRETVIALESWISSGVTNHLLRRPIYLDCSHARPDHAAQLLQHLTDEAAGRAHFLQFFFGLSDYHRTLCADSISGTNRFPLAADLLLNIMVNLFGLPPAINPTKTTRSCIIIKQRLRLVLVSFETNLNLLF